MTAPATTIRLDPALREGLIKLSKLRSTTLNKMINKVLKEFVANDALALQQEFEASIKELERLISDDPDFEQAINRVVSAEPSSAEDPAQGTLELSDGHETTDLVRELLSA